jgi:hypothetical protein
VFAFGSSTPLKSTARARCPLRACPSSWSWPEGLGGAPTASTTVLEVLLPYCALRAGSATLHAWQQRTEVRTPRACRASGGARRVPAGSLPLARARSAAEGPPAGYCSGAPIGARHHDWTPGARRSRPAAAVPCRRQALMAATTCKCSAPGSVSEQDSLNSSLNALPSSLASKRPASLNQTWNICTPPHTANDRGQRY